MREDENERRSMNPHLQYLSYVIRHKWYVLKECFSYGLYWRGIVHDWSKFLPSEWFPYVHHFYGSDKKAQQVSKAKTGYYHVPSGSPFDYAWLRHIHRNPHHWQYWLLTQDEDENKTLEMPTDAFVEMVCDWRGAGRAQGHGDDLVPWYNKNRGKIQLHPTTREAAEFLVERSTCTSTPSQP